MEPNRAMRPDRLTESKGDARKQRPSFPARAVVTAGMPYGNKELHFGHVGGMFIHADVYARFLRDRLGKENVLFVSGTDCYGSAIEVTYESLLKQGLFAGTIEDFVAMNHAKQSQVLDAYAIQPDLYAASALGEAGAVHRQASRAVFDALHGGGFLKLMETKQFYDADQNVFLNGRQVTGRCPIEGCKSEFGYADECSLGHQYSPEELIAPVSALSGKAPSLRPVWNWCFDLERFNSLISAHRAQLESEPSTRGYLTSVIEEFLRPPMIYVKKEQRAQVDALAEELPPHTVQAEARKTSDALVFDSIEDRALARRVLDSRRIRYRTGKTLVPFRLTGNVAWGIPVPEREGIAGLTFWVWPESLWAPVSFTQACLAEQGKGPDAWRRWWASTDARVYQFIGEDNIYFYAVAQTGLFMALQGASEDPLRPADGALQLTTVVPNRHVLYKSRKASSSSADKPPKAEELLAHYTREQLRMHFFHLNLAANSVSFTPKAFDPAAQPNAYDPVLYEGNILTNIYNRLARSCFYTAQQHFHGKLPQGAVSESALEKAEALILSYEWAMFRFEFGRVIDLLDTYLREANKRWASESKQAAATQDDALRRQLLVDSFHAVRVAATLLHPLAPDGTEMIRDYLVVDEGLWDWSNIFLPLSGLVADAADHALRPLAPRVDFFRKHQSQLSAHEKEPAD